MGRHLGPRLLGAVGILLMAVSAAWGAGLFDRPTAPPGAIASTNISITVGDGGLFSWTGEQMVSAAGVVLGLVLLLGSIVWSVRTRAVGRRLTASFG
ncbi:hypothetical protein [Modestobacter lapidis]|nr:hypothetical protein [Modestobacter lapidis]